jgi:threonine dehydratase
MFEFKLKDFLDAQQVISSILPPTPLVYSHWLSQKYQAEIYLKLENMQPIGSFKIRGALNKIASLSSKEKDRGVVAVSAGNHAQGVAWAARHFKTHATIVMPTNAPLTKIENTKSLGAEVILHGNNFESAYEFARTLIQRTKAVLVHPYEDQHVIAGQGTLVLELLEQQKKFDCVIGSIGGGGLVAGVGQALKLKKHPAQLIAGQAYGARSMVESIKRKKIYRTHEANTFADGIKVKEPSLPMFDLLKNLVDEAYYADDEEIAAAILSLIEKARLVTEGAGALPLAILDKMFQQAPKKIKGKKIILLICGGNIDVNVLGHIIDRGLTVTGRRIRLNILVQDKPGTLNHLTNLLADEGANILQVIHDRSHPLAKINETAIELTLETKGALHGQEILKHVKKHYPMTEIL